MELAKSKKGSAFTWASALIIIFGVGLIYIVMTRPFQLLYDLMYPLVDPEFQTVFLQLRSVWYIWPLILVIGTIVWAVLRSMRRDPNEFYYG